MRCSVVTGGFRDWRKKKMQSAASDLGVFTLFRFFGPQSRVTHGRERERGAEDSPVSVLTWLATSRTECLRCLRATVGTAFTGRLLLHFLSSSFSSSSHLRRGSTSWFNSELWLTEDCRTFFFCLPPCSLSLPRGPLTQCHDSWWALTPTARIAGKCTRARPPHDLTKRAVHVLLSTLRLQAEQRVVRLP